MWRCSCNSKVWRFEHRKVVYQNLEKNSKTSFSEMVISADFQATKKISWGIFFQIQFAHHQCTLSSAIHSDPSQWFLSGAFFVWHIVVFFQCGLDILKFGHARRLGRFNREITLTDEYLSQFLPELKVLWMTLEQLFHIFIKLPIFDSRRAICVLLRGQN